MQKNSKIHIKTCVAFFFKTIRGNFAFCKIHDMQLYFLWPTRQCCTIIYQFHPCNRITGKGIANDQNLKYDKRNRRTAVVLAALQKLTFHLFFLPTLNSSQLTGCSCLFELNDQNQRLWFLRLVCSWHRKIYNLVSKVTKKMKRQRTEDGK